LPQRTRTSNPRRRSSGQRERQRGRGRRVTPPHQPPPLPGAIDHLTIIGRWHNRRDRRDRAAPWARLRRRLEPNDYGDRTIRSGHERRPATRCRLTVNNVYPTALKWRPDRRWRDRRQRSTGSSADPACEPRIPRRTTGWTRPATDYPCRRHAHRNPVFPHVHGASDNGTYNLSPTVDDGYELRDRDTVTQDLGRRQPPVGR